MSADTVLRQGTKPALISADQCQLRTPTGFCGRWGEPSRSRVEAAPNVQWSRAIEIRLYPPLSQTAFSSASQFTTFSFSYPPTPTPVDLYLFSVILSTVIKSLSDRYTNRGRDPALPSGSFSTFQRPPELALGPAQPITHLSLILSAAPS